MKLDIMQQWTAALRSGEYQQGTGALRRNDETYCCLGVLCALAAEEGIVSFDGPLGDDDKYSVFTPVSNIRNSAYLPRAVKEWAGMNNTDSTAGTAGTLADGMLNTSKGRFFSLAAANDEGVPFSEIADLIEAHADML